MVDLSWAANVPIATVFLMGVAFTITLVNQSIYRALISHFIGWNEYRAMQKEMNAYNKERMAAARANDTKQLEKLKKKESHINALRAKMMKPQMLNMGTIVIYFIVWQFLRPVFANAPVAYLPGYSLSLFIWYMPVSFCIGLLMQRILGTQPIE
jgi:uncharacterized membrane protein (DUF106 family)